MDKWIDEFLTTEPAGSIVLLGVGLDTVFQRNDNGGNFTWFELDFEDVVCLREKCFEPNERRHGIAGNLFDTQWIDLVKAKGSGPWLFQAAGLLMYLPPDKVKSLFRLLADHFPDCTFLFDGCSDLALKNSHRWEATIRTTTARYQWSIDDPREIENWDPRIRITDVRYLLDYHRHQWRLATRIWSRLLPKLRTAYHVNRAHLSAAR